MENLPNRNDDIYKEIESFEDYEFTQCIAYEMAIRNEEVKKIQENITILSKNLSSEFQNIRDDDSHPFNIEFEKQYNEWFEYQDCKFDDDEDKPEPSYEKIFCNQNNTFIDIQNLSQILVNNYWIFYQYNLRGDSNHPLIKFFEIIEKLKREHLVGKIDTITVNKNGDFIKKVSSISEQNEHLEINITKLFNINITKNKLFIPRELNKEISIPLNLQLPKNDLIAYISKIKDEYDKDNSIIKTPLELIGMEFKKSNTKISKKLMADMFFVYDYVKVKQIQKKLINENLEMQLNEDIEIIQNSKYDTFKQKKIQINQLKKDYKDNINNEILKDIFSEISTNGIIEAGTAKTYYFTIKPFIDDCKYKELITGIKQN